MADGRVIRVLVVDDHRVVREGLRSYLELVDDIENGRGRSRRASSA